VTKSANQRTFLGTTEAWQRFCCLNSPKIKPSEQSNQAIKEVFGLSCSNQLSYQVTSAAQLAEMKWKTHSW